MREGPSRGPRVLSAPPLSASASPALAQRTGVVVPRVRAVGTALERACALAVPVSGGTPSFSVELNMSKHLNRTLVPVPKAPAVEPEPGASLHVTVDPRGWFDNVDFSKLDTTGGPPYRIPDSNADANGFDFFQGLESSSGVYSFTFKMP